MKTVTCKNSSISGVSDVSGHSMSLIGEKVPERGKDYRVTGEISFNGILYYLLMGFGIKTAFRADKFQDAV
jgi:hypothetical protein